MDLSEILEATPEAVAAALASLAEEADTPARGVRLESVAGGWRYVTRPEFDSLLRKFHEVTERSRLSLAALETLARKWREVEAGQDAYIAALTPEREAGRE